MGWSTKKIDDGVIPSSLKMPDIVLAVLLGVCSSAANDCLGSNGTCKIDFPFVLRALIIAGLIFSLFCLLRAILSRSYEVAFADKFLSFFIKARPRAWQSILLVAALIFACWLPYLILLFPGNIYMDTSLQLEMYESFVENRSASVLNTHHPLFDMFVFGFIVDTVYGMTGSYQAGIFSLTLIQAVCTALSFSIATVYACRRWRCANLIVCMMVFFFALLPLLPILVCNISKDSFFSWIYVLFLTSLIDILMAFKRGDSPNRRSIVLLCLSGVFMCCTKNFGIYVVIGTLIALVFCRKKRVRDTFQIAIPVILCAMLVSGCAFILPKMFGITGGGAQEALSVPFQQTALSLIRHGDAMSQQDKEIIAKVIDVDTVEEDYTPHSADGVKGYAPKGSRSDYVPYIKTWLKQGFLYPKDYLDALVAHEANLFTATPIRHIFNSEWTKSSSILPEGYNVKSEFSAMTSSGVKDFYDWLIGVPLLNILFLSFTYALFIPAFFICSIGCSSKARPFLPVIVATLVTLAGIMLSPIPANHMEATRYLIPMVYTAPLLVGISSLVLQERDGTSRASEAD